MYSSSDYHKLIFVVMLLRYDKAKTSFHVWREVGHKGFLGLGNEPLHLTLKIYIMCPA